MARSKSSTPPPAPRYGLNFTDELAIYYNEPDYGPTFNLDRLQQQADQIVDRTVHPNGSTPSTLDLLRQPEESSSVTIDAATGDVALIGDDAGSGGGAGSGAFAGSGSEGGPDDRTELYRREVLGRAFGSAYWETKANTTGTRYQYTADPLLDTIPLHIRRQLREQRIADEVERQRAAERDRVDPSVVQGLVQDGMAVFVRERVTRPVYEPDYPTGMIAVDQPTIDPEGYVVVTDAVGDRIVTAILEKQQDSNGADYYRLIWKSDGWPLKEGTTAEEVAALLKARRTPEWAQTYVETFVTDKLKIQAFHNLADNLEATQQFLLHLIPGVSATQAAWNGEWGEFAFSLAGDAALLLGGPLKAMAASRGFLKTAEVAHLSAVAIEGTISGVRLGQSAYEFYNGDNIKAAGHLGEAFLRLYGVKLIAGNRGVWGMRDALRRGEILEARLGKNTPTQFERIDRWEPENGLAISIKTTDIKGRSLKAVESDLRKWAREIAQFSLRMEKKGKIVRQGFEIKLSDITSRGLRVGIEPGVATSLQRDLFERIKDYAINELGLDFVEFVEVK